MDKYQTIHVVSEIAVLTLMYMHFDKKIKTLEAELDHVKKTYVNTFDDVYQKMEVLKQGILQSTTQNTQNTQNIKSPRESKPKVMETVKQVNFDNFTIFDIKPVLSKKQEDSPKIQIIEEEKEPISNLPETKTTVLEPITEESEEITETEITEIESLIEKGKID
jgi:hypothetical protein